MQRTVSLVLPWASPDLIPSEFDELADEDEEEEPGLHCEHALNPLLRACSIVMDSETFLT